MMADLWKERNQAKPKVGERSAASFRADAVGLARRQFSVNQSDSDEVLGAGVHPKVVSERLGHAGVSITLDIYSRVLPCLQEEAANLLDAYLKRPPAEVG